VQINTVPTSSASDFDSLREQRIGAYLIVRVLVFFKRKIWMDSSSICKGVCTNLFIFSCQYTFLASAVGTEAHVQGMKTLQNAGSWDCAHSAPTPAPAPSLHSPNIDPCRLYSKFVFPCHISL
jgi:hypothetical protein